MIEAHSNKHKNQQKTKKLAIFMIPAAAASLLVSVVATTTSNAEAILIPLQEHWKYNVRWDWDPDHYRTVGYIDPKIVILNQTDDKIVGYIGDQNGTRLSMYKGDQYVQVRYAYSNGLVTKWKIGDRINDGYFTIDIPEDYRNADVVGIYIGNNEYTIDDGTLYAPQTSVFINSARIDYYRNSTIEANSTTDAVSTTMARILRPTATNTTTAVVANSTTDAVSTTMARITSTILDHTTTKTTTAITKERFSRLSPGSLIDLILSRVGLLPTDATTKLQNKYAAYEHAS
jgi:hypothetical protein